MTLQSIAGTGASATTQHDAAIQLWAQAGGIGLASDLAGDDAIRLETSNAAGLMTLQSIAGTGASATGEEDAAIQLYAQAGGVALTSGLAAADAIRIEAQGADGQITIQNKLGTTASVATEFDASIQLYSEAGGIGLHSKLNGADAIRIEEGGGTGGTINIHANTGNAVADGAASINLLSDVGGIGLKANGLASANAIWIQAAAGGVNIDAQAAYDVDIDGGQILLTAAHGVADAIKLHADTGAAQTIAILNDEGNTAGAIDLTATAGGIAMAAKDDFIVTLTTTIADDDMVLQTTGSDDSHIQILADGTSENAITITASGGNIDIQGDGASGEDLDITSTNSALNLNSGEGTVDAIKLNASNAAGGITMNYGTSNMVITGTGASADFTLDCDLFSIDGTGSSNVTVAATEAGEDLTISQTGTNDSSVAIVSSGQGLDGILLHSDGTIASGILIHSETGTGASAAAQTDAALQLKASAGGIGIASALNAADAIRLETSGAAAQITVEAAAGIGASAAAQYDAAIQLYAQAGGIGLLSGLNNDDSIRIETNGGANENITIRSNQGTGTDSIYILSDEGGIELEATTSTAVTEGASAVQLTASAGAIELYSGLNATNAIKLTADGGGNSDIVIYNDQGTT